MCNSNYEIVPITTKAVKSCESACAGTSGTQDDICCCNFFLWPVTFILDIVLCPCLYGYYKYNKRNENNENNT